MEFGITLKSFCSERVKFDIPWIMTLFHQVVTKDALYKAVSTCPTKLANEIGDPKFGFAWKALTSAKRISNLQCSLNINITQWWDSLEGCLALLQEHKFCASVPGLVIHRLQAPQRYNSKFQSQLLLVKSAST